MAFSLMRIRRLARFFLIFTVFLCGVFVIMLLTLPTVSNTPPVKQFILRALSGHSGFQIEVEELALTVLPRPNIKMKNISLFEQGAGDQMGTVEELDIEFDLFPLMFQTVIVTHGTLVRPVLRVALDSQERSSATPESGDFSFSSLVVPMQIQDFQITGGQLTVSRPLGQGRTGSLSWSAIEIRIETGLESFPIVVHLSGIQTDQTGPHGILLTGRMNRENSWGSPLESAEAQQGLTHHFTGHLKINDLDLRPMMEIIGTESLPSNWAARGQLQTPIDLFFEGPRWSVTFSNLEGQINELHVQGQGNVLGTTGSKPSVFFRGSSSPISYKALQALVLPSWLPPELASTLLAHRVEGDIEVLEAVYSGSLNEKEAVSLLGVVKVANGQFQVSSDLPSVKNVSALVGLNPQQLMISEIQADYGASHMLSGKVDIANFDSTPEYTADVMVAWKARDLVKTLIVFPPSQDLLPRLRSLENLRGEGELEFKLKGPLTDPSQMLIQDAKVSAHHLGFRSSALPLSLKGWSGTVHWNQNELSIQKLTGILGNSPVTFSGIVSNRDTPHLRQGLFSAEMDHSDVRSLFPKMLRRPETVSGKAEIVAHLSGPLNMPNWNGRIDLQNLTLSIPSVMEKPHGVPAWLEFSGTGGVSGTVVAHHLSLNLPPFALNGQGKVSNGKALHFEGTLRSQPVENGGPVSGIILGGSGFSPNHFDVSLNIQGSGHDWTQWNMAGFLAASEVRSPVNTEDSHSKEMTVQVNLQEQLITMKFRTDRIDLGTIMGAFGNDSPPLVGDVSLQGNVEVQARDQQLTVDTFNGDLTFLISSGRLNHITAVSRILGVLNLPSLLMGKVNLLEEGMPFDRITGKLLVKNGLVSTEDLLVDSPVMKLAATGNFDLSTDQLDLVVAASPFGKYSDLLKSIPMFGQLLTGERRGLTTALFKVSGSRKDPTVKYQPFESLAGGVQGLGKLAVDVLTNVINIPKRAVEATKNAPSLGQKKALPNPTGGKVHPPGN